MTSGGAPTPDLAQHDASDQAQVRLEFAWTILLDTGLIVTAVVSRWGALWVIRHFNPAAGPGETHTWAIRLLEIISDVSIVSAAAIFTAFDLAKRVLRSYRAFAHEIRNRSSLPGDAP